MKKGIFGVPSFVVNEKLFFGADRLVLVEKELGVRGNGENQIFFFNEKILKKVEKKFVFVFDFSSPWSFIASTQIERIARECNAQIELCPILLGALFKKFFIFIFLFFLFFYIFFLHFFFTFFFYIFFFTFFF